MVGKNGPETRRGVAQNSAGSCLTRLCIRLTVASDGAGCTDFGQIRGRAPTDVSPMDMSGKEAITIVTKLCKASGLKKAAPETSHASCRL